MEPGGSAAEAPDETAQHGIGDEQHSMELDGTAAPSRPQAQPDRHRSREDGGNKGSKGKDAATRNDRRDKYSAKAKQGKTRDT